MSASSGHKMLIIWVGRSELQTMNFQYLRPWEWESTNHLIHCFFKTHSSISSLSVYCYDCEEEDSKATRCQTDSPSMWQVAVLVLPVHSLLSAWASDLWAQSDSAYLQERTRTDVKNGPARQRSGREEKGMCGMMVWGGGQVFIL